MNIDIRTSLLAMFCVNLVFAVAFLLIEWRQPRKWGARYLIAAGLLTALAFAGLALRDRIPDILSIVLANCLHIAGALAAWQGVRVLLGLPVRVVPVIIVFVLTACGHLAFTYGWSSIAARQFIYSLAAMTVFGLSLRDIVRQSRGRYTAEVRVLHAVVLVAITIHLIRVVLITLAPSPTSYLASTQVDSVFLFLGVILTMGEFLSLIAMITARIDGERLQQQEALRLSDARFRDLVSMSSDWFWEQDRDLRFVQMSGGFRDRAGGSPESTIGKTRWELNHVDVTDGQWTAHQAQLERHEPFENFCFRMRDLAGDIHWVSVAGKPLFDDAGLFIGYRGTGRDVTEEKRREAQSVNDLHMLELLARNLPCREFLERLVRSYELIFPDVICSILLLDADGQHLRHGAAPSLSKAYCEAIDGMTIGPLAGSCGTAAWSGQSVVVQDTLSDPRWADFRDLARIDGLRACWSTPIIASAGRVLGAFAVYHREPVQPDQEKLSAIERGAYLASLALERADAEAMKLSLEGQLRESQKMQAIGTLAGGIAHDFNNIVAAILGNAELARQDAAGNRHLLVSLDEIAKAGQRARNLTQQILSFSRRQPTARRLVAPGPLVEEAGRLLRATLPARVEVDVELESDLPAVLADATQISQVLLNLGTNAAYAIGARPGRIRLRVDAPLIDDQSVKPHPDMASGRYVRISVVDNGTGMDAATLERIFEPFFTTKPVGEGTGLGLSVAHGIMRNHEGMIVARSEVGTGSVFELYIPASQAANVVPPEAPSQPGSGTGDGRQVLYIDDDEAMVLLVERMLGRRGYRVTARADAEAALSLVRAAPKAFDLVVTDFNMPGLSGLDVARQLRAIRPDLPVAVTSGFISEELRAGAPDAGVCEIIFKPDTVEELCDVIQRLLLQQPGPA